MNAHQVVGPEEWVRARQALLQAEKESLRARDALARARQELPWTRIEKKYVFDTETGKKTLEELFDGRSQLVVYHFMFGPNDAVGCKACSFWADNFDHIGPHLAARDTTFMAVSRAPLEKLLAFKNRLGWTFTWVSSGGTDFNQDLGVSFDDPSAPQTYNYAPKTSPGSERPGASVFYRDGAGSVFHTYSTYARGLDPLNVAYQYLDLTPKGRDEDALPFSMTWVRFHDEYDARK